MVLIIEQVFVCTCIYLYIVSLEHGCRCCTSNSSIVSVGAYMAYAHMCTAAAVTDFYVTATFVTVLQAGGLASTGMFKGSIQRVLEVVPKTIHDKCPIILGTPAMVETVLGLYKTTA